MDFSERLKKLKENNTKRISGFIVLILSIICMMSCKPSYQVDSTKYINKHWHQKVDKKRLLYSDSDFSRFNGEGSLYAVYEYDNINELDILFNKSNEEFAVPKSNLEVVFIDYLKERLDNYDNYGLGGVLENVPEEYRIDFNTEGYYWYYTQDPNHNEMYVLYDVEKAKLYYYIIVW